MDKILITIGRQFGSGGKLVAQAIGDKLGIPVYDNEVITEAAERSGFSKELFEKSDEKRSLFSFSSFFAPSPRAISLHDAYTSDDMLFKIQSSVIRELASKSSAVFVGRCSDYILRDLPCTDVFITADMQTRIKRVAERAGLSCAEAEKLIARQDRARETYYNYFTFGAWGVASNYDLCLDSSILGIDGTADTVIAFAKAAGKEYEA